MTKSPKDTFLRLYPHHEAVNDYMYFEGELEGFVIGPKVEGAREEKRMSPRLWHEP